MMINCPKCNLLQPKDQYCARCGINMETWQPPPTPLWKKLLGNWMVQLGLLFVAILAVVLLDSIRNKPAIFQPELPPLANQEFERTETQEQEVASPPTAEPMVKQSGRAIVQKQPATEASQPTSRADASPALKKQATLRAMLISRRLIERIAQQAQRLEESAFVIADSALNQLLKEGRADIQSLGSVRAEYNFNRPSLLFVGEEDLETGLSIGFVAQLSVSDKSQPQSIVADVNVWNQLVLSGDQGPQLSVDATLPASSSLVVIDLSAHSPEFSQEERNLFEASRKLRVLNEETFIEQAAEIALVLSIN